VIVALTGRPVEALVTWPVIGIERFRIQRLPL
jgi:hypothetical protein